MELKTLTLDGTLWNDELPIETDGYIETSSFADWSFKVLVVRMDSSKYDSLYPPLHIPNARKRAVELFFDNSLYEGGSFLERVERIEFRTDVKMEDEFRAEVAERKKVGLRAFERRSASMIVFVDEDGRERRLLDE